MKIKSIILTALIAIAATSGLFARNKADAKSNNKTLADKGCSFHPWW